MDFPAAANSRAKRLAYAWRYLEKLRLRHNERGELAKLTGQMHRFSEWQQKVYQPMEKQALEMISTYREYTEEEHDFRKELRRVTTWDSEIDVRDA